MPLGYLGGLPHSPWLIQLHSHFGTLKCAKEAGSESAHNKKLLQLFPFHRTVFCLSEPSLNLWVPRRPAPWSPALCWYKSLLKCYPYMVPTFEGTYEKHTLASQLSLSGVSDPCRLSSSCEIVWSTVHISSLSPKCSKSSLWVCPPAVSLWSPGLPGKGCAVPGHSQLPIPWAPRHPRTGSIPTAMIRNAHRYFVTTFISAIQKWRPPQEESLGPHSILWTQRKYSPVGVRAGSSP